MTKSSYRKQRQRQLAEFNEWWAGFVGLTPEQVRQRWRDRIAPAVERNMMRAARNGSPAQPAAAPAPGMILRCTRPLTIGNKDYQRGAAIPPADVTGARNFAALVSGGTLVWSAPTGTEPTAPPRTLEPPAPSYPNPGAELIAEVVRDATAAHSDVVCAYQYAVAGVERLLHESVRYRAPDLLLTVQSGASLSSAAHRDVSLRYARDHRAPPGRRPYVKIPRLADEQPPAA
jgi:hypothetical protein